MVGACRARTSGYIAEYGPAHGDQTKRIRLRHLDDAVQTDIDVPARGGLHRANPRWRLDADIHRPWRFPFYGLSSRLFPLFVLSSVKLEEALAGERLLKPVEKLGGRIDLVVMLAIGKHRHLVQVFGKPRCILRDRDKAVFDHCGLRVQPHDLLALRLVAGDTVAALADQFLDQLGARGLSSISTTLALNRFCCSRTARLSAGYSSRWRSRPSR